MLRSMKTMPMVFALATLAPHAVLAAGGHTVWRAPDSEMGPVSWTGFTLTPEISDHTLHLRGAGRALLENPDGFRAGVALGYDHQAGTFVAGVIGDVFHSWMDGRHAEGALGVYRSALPYMGSLRARLGYAHHRFMAYGTGGFALARMTIEDQTHVTRVSKTMAGWAAGAGVEYAWNKHLTARIEYLHTQYGAYGFGILPTAGNRISSSMDPVTFHVAFRF